MKNIEAKDLDLIIGKAYLIDIREDFELEMLELKKVEGLMHIPREELLENHKHYLNFESEYHIMCASGGRSSGVTKELESLGYKVINVNGGIESYRGNNLIIHMKELYEFY